jgi:hypothetical protein
VVGGEFFDEEPEHSVTGLFVYMKDMRAKQARATELLKSKGYIDFAEKVKEVRQLGYREAFERESSPVP